MARRTLLALARRAGIPIGHPCRGEGICGKCGVKILEGAELLEPPTEQELELLRNEGSEPGTRMSCLAEPCRTEPRGAGPLVFRVGGGTYRIELPSPTRR